MPRFSLDDATKAQPDDRAAMDATNEAEIQRQIAKDADTAPDLGDLDPGAFSLRRAWPDFKELRGRLGLSQPEFAAAYGLSVWTLRQWEQGVAEPAAEVAAAKYPILTFRLNPLFYSGQLVARTIRFMSLSI